MHEQCLLRGLTYSDVSNTLYKFAQQIIKVANFKSSSKWFYPIIPNAKLIELQGLNKMSQLTVRYQIIILLFFQ